MTFSAKGLPDSQFIILNFPLVFSILIHHSAYMLIFIYPYHMLDKRFNLRFMAYDYCLLYRKLVKDISHFVQLFARKSVCRLIKDDYVFCFDIAYNIVDYL